MNVLCVCTGNMCRSPMLTALLRDALAKEGLDLTVSGAGTSTTDGKPPSPHAVTVMQEIGMDISELRSRQITPEIVAETDIFVALSVLHGVTLAFQYGADAEHILVPGAGVPDPIGLDLTAYRECRDLMIATLPQLVEDIKALL